jgi:phosphatidate cytidylyltransferase
MIRVLSGAVLIVLAVAVVWFSSAVVFLIVAEALLVLAFIECVALARATGADVPAVAAAVAAALTCAAFSTFVREAVPMLAVDLVLMVALVVVGAAVLLRWTEGPGALSSAAAALFPSLYLGLPIGAMVSIRETRGPAALFLMMATIIVSDSAQYYTGRAFGKRPLAPAISPKKTTEGAMGGFIFGAVFLVTVGRWWLPETTVPMRVTLGLAVVGLGITGDLFESMLKRSAGVKDSSSLIPGHGGILDRIDALLFAAPIYYVVLRFV